MTGLLRAGAAFLLGLFAASCAPSGEEAASATGRDRGTGFDFYVLALSWSPSYCREDGADPSQCSIEARHRFVVHGLWPQFEDGYPEFCDGQRRDVPRDTAAAIRDLMPSNGLIRHQWRKHGSCTGLDPDGYFTTVREARERVNIPDVAAGRATSPRDIEMALLAANPGLTADGVAITCARSMLREVRICLSKGLEFRACPQIGNRDCRSRTIDVPAPR